jgi:hypothetical protein
VVDGADVTDVLVTEQPAEPAMAPTAPRRPWSRPESPVTREQVDQWGRQARTAARKAGAVAADAARSGARGVAHVWREIGAVPPAVRLFVGTGVLMLTGVAGALTLHDTLGLLCTVVVIPVCAATLGALGHRWYSGLGDDAAPRADTRPPASDLERSVHYVDRKLALALTSLGTERHQQAVIALFQAKTAVELTLGTEQDDEGSGDLLVRADDYGLRPRIRAGSEATPALREGDSLAAS